MNFALNPEACKSLNNTFPRSNCQSVIVMWIEQSKVYGTVEPRYNEARCNEDPVVTNTV